MANPQIKAVITAEDRASKVIGNVGNSFGKMAGAVAVGQLAAQSFTAVLQKTIDTVKDVVSSTVEWGKNTNKLKRELGLTAEEASGLLSVGKRFGLGVDELSKSLGIFSKKVVAANDGNAEARKEFSRYGVSVRDAEGNLKNFNQLFGDVADKFSKAPNGFNKTAEALKLFGRSGKDLLPILNLGRDGIAEIVQQAKKYGLILSESNLKDVVGYIKGQRELGMAWQGLKITLGTALMPALTRLAEELAKLAGDPKFRQWIQDMTDKLSKNMPIWIENIEKFIKSINWQEVSANAQSIANSIMTMASIINAQITWSNKAIGRFVQAMGWVVFQVSYRIESIKSKFNQWWANVKNSTNIIIAAIKRVPGNIASSLRGVGDKLMAPFRTAFNWILSMIATVQAAINGLSAGNIGSVAKTVAGAAAKAAAKATGTDFFTPRKYATGTGNASGGMALVGERGPEMVTLPRGSKVARNDETNRMMGGSTTINISVPMMTGSATERRKVARMLIKDIQDLASMNGKGVTDMLTSNYGLIS